MAISVEGSSYLSFFLYCTCICIYFRINNKNSSLFFSESEESKKQKGIVARVARSSAFCGKCPHFFAFRKFFDTFSINRFHETIRQERMFFGKSMTIIMQSLQNHWKEIDMEALLRRSRKNSTYQP